MQEPSTHAIRRIRENPAANARRPDGGVDSEPLPRLQHLDPGWVKADFKPLPAED